MFCIGLTGQLASGKSTVAGYFKQLGIEIINADAIAKQLTQQGQWAFEAIVAHFGACIRLPSGELDRRQLRQRIFNEPHERQWLEQLLHPFIREQIITTIPHLKGPYCIIEIPLLSNKDTYPYLDRILFIQAHQEQQILRFMARDNSTREEALSILATQASQQHLQSIADDILQNTGTAHDLKAQVQALHHRYISEAKYSQHLK